MSKIIAIDAGHGMGTAGKRCLKSIDPNQTREWYLNARIADRLQELLAAYGCQVIRGDDTTGKKDIALSGRVKAANNAKADVYVSIHHNAGIAGGTGGGTVVFYSSSKKERPGQAKRLYDAIVTTTGLRGNRSQRVINKGYYVIKHTDMPAFLIENGFMDSRTDTPIILTQAHAEKTAQGIAKWLVEEFNLVRKEGDVQAPGSVTGQGKTSNPYPVPTYTLYRFRPGMKKEHIRWMQWALNRMNYGLKLDGKFGPATEAALRDAQKRLGLKTDGRCGPATRTALKNM